MPKVNLEVQRLFREPGQRRAEAYGPGENVEVPQGLADSLKREAEEGRGHSGLLFAGGTQAPVSDAPRNTPRVEAPAPPERADLLPAGYTSQSKSGGWTDIFDPDGNKVDTVRGGDELAAVVAKLAEAEDEA